MNKIILWAALSAALCIHAMHVSSDDEQHESSSKKNIEMKDFAAKPPIQTQQSSLPPLHDETKQSRPVYSVNLIRGAPCIYSPIYTLASIEKK